MDSLPVAAEVGIPPPVPATLPGDLLRRRPDIRAAEWKVLSAAATLKVDDLAVLPTLNLQPGFSLTKSTGPFGFASHAWSIGADLTLPVLDRPRLLAAIHAQRAVLEQDLIAYERAVQTAYGDVETALTYLDSDARRVALLREAEEHARAAYQKAGRGYARGINNLTTALQAESTWRGIDSQLSSAQTTWMQRSVQVFKALGGGWTPRQPAQDTVHAAGAQWGAALTGGLK